MVRTARSVALASVLTAVISMAIVASWLTVPSWTTFGGVEQRIPFLTYMVSGLAGAAVGALIWRRPGDRINYLARVGGLTFATAGCVRLAHASVWLRERP